MALVYFAIKALAYTDTAAASSLAAAAWVSRPTPSRPVCQLWEDPLSFDNAAFQRCALVPQHTIAVVTSIHRAGGLGDLSGGAKIYRHLTKRRPQDAVIFVIDGLWESKLRQFSRRMAAEATYIKSYNCPPPRQAHPDFHKFCSTNGNKAVYYDSPAISNADLTIYYPMGTELASMFHMMIGKKPSISLREYNFTYKIPNDLFQFLKMRGKTLASLGVGEGHLGIMFDKKLHNAYRQGLSLSPAQRLKPLARLPKPLQEALLGAEYSPKSAEAFTAQGKLYFGYSANPLSKDAFCAMISHLSFDHQGHITQPTIVLAGIPITPLLYFETDFSTDNQNGVVEDRRISAQDQRNMPFFKALVKAGVEELELYWTADQQADSLKKAKVTLNPKRVRPNQPNTLRIFSFTKGLQHKHVLALARASSREMLGTGDQMLSEALALGKFLIYEMFEYKRALAEGLIHAAPPRTVQIAEKLFATLTIKTQIDVSHAFYGDHIERGLEGFRLAREHVEDWNSYIRLLNREYDCFENIDRLVEESLN